MRAPVAALLMAALMPAGARADGPALDDGTLLVRALHAPTEEAPLAARLTDEVLVALSAAPGLRVIGQRELEVMMGHAAERDAMDCETDEACLARLAARASAARYVSGRLGRLGERIAVTLKLVDTRRGRVIAAEACDGGSASEAIAACVAAARRMIDLPSGAPPRSPATPRPTSDRMAVFGLRAHGVRPDLSEGLAEMLSVELRRAGVSHVVSRRDVADMVGHEVQRHLLACDDDTECLLEIAGNLDVDVLVSGSIGRLDDTWFVHLNLLDMRRARVVGRASESFRGPESTLPFALRAVTWRLIGADRPSRGELRLRATVDQGELRIGAGAPLRLDGAPVVGDHPTGRLGVSLTADGFAPLFEDVYVEGGRATAFVLEPIALPVPWYREWWVWTTAGVVVVGAVAAGWALSDLEPDTGTVVVRSAR